MTDNAIFETPQAQLSQKPDEPRRVGKVFLAITVTLALLASALAFVANFIQEPSIGYALGGVIAVHVFPWITIGIFSIWKSKRNSVTRTKIYFWWSLIFLLSILSTVARVLV